MTQASTASKAPCAAQNSSRLLKLLFIMAQYGGGGYTSRGGLNPRTLHGQQDQIAINVGSKFDFDSEVEDLRGHVKKLKQLSRAIEDETRQQGEIINGLEDTLERAKLLMTRTMGRLNVAYRQARSNHLLFIVLFGIAMFIGLYILGKMYRIGRSIVG